MILLPKPSSFGWYTDNWGSTPSTSFGTTVNLVASNVDGNWTQLLDDLAADALYIELIFFDFWKSAAENGTSLIDIGYNPSGGDNTGVSVTLLEDIQCGGASFVDQGLPAHGFPIRIPSGASVFARGRRAAGSNGAGKVAIRAFGRPSAPESMWSGSYSETFGAVPASSAGTGIALGANSWNTTIGSAAGNWHSLGVSAKRLNHITVMAHNSTATSSAEPLWLEVGYGDGSNVVICAQKLAFYADTAERILRYPNAIPLFCDIPAGSTIYVRGMGDASPDSTYKVIVVGVG